MDFLAQIFEECSAMHLFHLILIMHVLSGTLILMKKKQKQKTKTKAKNKIQVLQNKSIRLNKMHHIFEEDFRLIT